MTSLQTFPSALAANLGHPGHGHTHSASVSSVNAATPSANGSWLSPQSSVKALPQSNRSSSNSTFDLSGPSSATTVSSASDAAMEQGPFGSQPLDIGNTFQYPFVPQDLWQMPMTLEWDWADMTGYGGVEDSMAAGGLGGLGGTGVLNNIPTSSFAGGDPNLQNGAATH
jgi:hypothetical protein